MNRRVLLAACVALFLAGCASFDGRGLVPGQSGMADVEALMGTPAASVSRADGGKVLYYSREPIGRQNFAVTLGADGKVRSVEELLTLRNINHLTQGMTMQQVRELIGPPEPHLVTRLPRQARTVWEYPWSDLGDKRVLFVQFSDDGVVREVINARDDYYESPGGLP